MKLDKFEDLEVWKLARSYAANIYKETEIGDISKDYSFKDQLRRSAVSVMANIAEGFERRTDKEFSQFLFIAKASAGEIRSHLYIAFDVGYISQEQFNKLSKDILVISKSLSGFIKYLRKSL